MIQKDQAKMFIGADHAGFELKQQLIEALSEKLNFVDCGAHTMESVDYPEIAHKVASHVNENPGSMGVLVCSTGVGMSIAANRHPEIRAALCHNLLCVERARGHNDANILVLGSIFLTLPEALAMVRLFLSTPFEGGRHQRRIQQI